MILPAVFRPLILAWLAWVSYVDHRTWTIPWYLTWPVTVGMCLVQAARGAWAPLALFLVYLAWDTSYGDVRRLLGRRYLELRDDERWLIPTPLAIALTVPGVVIARGQGEGSFTFTLAFALVHAAWRWGWLPGGDVALLTALLALFPTMRFILLAALVVSGVALLRLYLRQREDLLYAGQMLFVAGPLAAWEVLRTALRQKAQSQPAAWLLALPGALAALLL